MLIWVALSTIFIGAVYMTIANLSKQKFFSSWQYRMKVQKELGKMPGGRYKELKKLFYNFRADSSVPFGKVLPFKKKETK